MTKQQRQKAKKDNSRRNDREAGKKPAGSNDRKQEGSGVQGAGTG